jgi:hypothetical protein
MAVAAPPAVAARPAFAARPTLSASPTYLIDPIPEPFDEPEAAAAPTPWPPLAQPGPNLVARPYSSGPALGAADPGHLAPPGAYLPPNARLAAATAGGADASGATASGAAVAGSAGATAVSLLDALPRLDAARLGDIGGGFVVVGSAMATLGFLLPWSDWVVGARSAGGYLDTWGLASPMHVLALSIVLLVLALGVVQTNVAPWFRSGVLGLLVGGLLIGLTWPYTIGPLGADFGANLTALGGLALVLGGGVATWACRHGDGRPLV